MQTDYALRTLIFVAGRPGRAKMADVADFYRISLHHLAKVVQQLARHKFLRSLRGVGGGIELARPAAEIRIGDVILAFEEHLHLLECVGTEQVCVIQPKCKLRFVLAQAEKLQIDYLNQFCLSDVVNPGGQLAELLPLARLAHE